MIVFEMWNGQGLGNQLACYVTTRCIALKNGYDWGIQGWERFKGSSFMNLDFGKKVTGGYTPIEGQTPVSLPDGIKYYYKEKHVKDKDGNSITPYDWELFKIKDNTKIDGIMQGEEYFKEYKADISEWLKVDLMEMPDDLCIINFRGGDRGFGDPKFFLRKKYWDDAIKNMKKINPEMKFKIVTDDILAAQKILGEYGFEITHDMKNDYISIQSAKYLIISNSSFAFFPAWLNENVKFRIAPKYWGRHNISNGYWSNEQNFTDGWVYQDRDGNLSTGR